jgi:hypothetical protein
MPIFARTKLVIHDDCLVPPGGPAVHPSFIDLEYKGPNPQNIYPEIKKLLLKIFRVDEKDLQEREFSWDRSKEEEKFKVRLDLIKDFDSFSFMEVETSLSGTARPSKAFGKEGEVKIRIDAWVRTEYPQDTIWQRSLFYELFRTLWHKLIYEDTRKKYLSKCRELVTMFATELKSFLNILPKI